jgi:hypothetical protein
VINQNYMNEEIKSTTATSALKIETVCFSKMLVFTYESAWYCNPEEYHLHCHKNLRSHNFTFVLYVSETWSLTS